MPTPPGKHHGVTTDAEAADLCSPGLSLAEHLRSAASNPEDLGHRRQAAPSHHPASSPPLPTSPISAAPPSLLLCADADPCFPAPPFAPPPAPPNRCLASARREPIRARHPHQAPPLLQASCYAPVQTPASPRRRSLPRLRRPADVSPPREGSPLGRATLTELRRSSKAPAMRR
nr:vegetative cell wall protein gp1-like [Aegilops tauschii subsp. strangulata]